MQVVYIPSTAPDRDGVARALSDRGFQAAYAGATSVRDLRSGTGALSAHSLVRQALPQVRVERRTVAGLPCEVFRAPQAREDGFIVYLHGGGFVRGSLELGRGNASAIALASGVPVMAVGYRQAPEHPFPAAIDDIASVWDALVREGTPASAMALIGESSGGTLALALPARLTAQARAMPAGIAALSPMADLSFTGASWHFNAARDVADIETGRRMVAHYLQGQSAAEPLASPVARDFRDRTPLLVAVGAHETMLSDAEYLARKAADAGCPVRLEIYGEMVHGFTRFDIPVAQRALESAASWCVERMAGTSQGHAERGLLL